MRLLRLEILNLASLDKSGGEVIDFQGGPLGSSNIFSIVGPTGSGKSTILDAICLALYNMAPRYPHKKGKRDNIEIYGKKDESENNRLSPTDGRNILTRGKRQGYSKLTFLANDGIIYRAEWHVSFNRVRFNDVVTNLFALTFENGVLVKEEVRDWAALPQIIGLDYEQFLRTVLIAQGAFANFLTASEEERYKLLEKLIGCEEMYGRIAAEISARRSAADAALTAVQAQVDAQARDLLNPEELKALEERIAALGQQDADVKKDLEEVRHALEWYEVQARHEQALQLHEKNLSDANANKAKAREVLERLALHDAAAEALDFYKDYRDCQAAIQTGEMVIADRRKAAADAEALMSQNNRDLEQLKANLAESQKKLDEYKPLISQALVVKGEIEAAQQMVKEKFNVCRLASCIPANVPSVQMEAELKEVSEAFAQQNAAFEKLDLHLLQQANSAAHKDSADIDNAIRVRTAIAFNAQTESDTCVKLADARKRCKQIEDELKEFDVIGLRRELETLRNTYTLMTSDKWEQHRAALRDGDPCPLCGAVHHPYAADGTVAQVTGELHDIITNKSAMLASQEEAEKALSSENVALMTQIDGYVATLKRLAGEAIDLNAEWAALSAAHPVWPADAAALKALKPGILVAVQNSDKALDEYKALYARVEDLRKQKDKKEKNLAYCIARETLQAKEARLRGMIGDNDPKSLETKLTRAIAQNNVSIQEKYEFIKKIADEHGRIKGVIAQMQDDLRDVSQRYKCSEIQLVSWLSSYNATAERMLTMQDIESIYLDVTDWGKLRAQRDTLNDFISQSLALVDNERKAIEKHQADRPEATKEALAARKVELEAVSNEELINAKAKHARHTAAAEALGALAQQKADAETLALDWKQIAQAIGGDGKTLRKIAQCYTLRFLIEHANVEIRKFSSRYELQQVKNSLAIRVIDHDRADDVRDTTSLSGGETFIVSLGLALGLSSLSSRNISFDNLFIDEGFGTLDPDTLATVIDSLAMLQSSQGKKVCVISHTDTMSERITTQIRIIKNGSSGSSYIKIV